MENEGFLVSSKVVDEEKPSGCNEVRESEKSYVNPWARSIADWYNIDHPSDQGRITATDGPPLQPKILRNVKALKKLLGTSCIIEKQFYQELAYLEVKYNNLRSPLYEQRAIIINGGEISADLLDSGDTTHSEADGTKGIPYFWRTCMMNSPYLTEILEPYDLPVLASLMDIRAR